MAPRALSDQRVHEEAEYTAREQECERPPAATARQQSHHQKNTE